MRLTDNVIIGRGEGVRMPPVLQPVHGQVRQAVTEGTVAEQAVGEVPQAWGRGVEPV